MPSLSPWPGQTGAAKALDSVGEIKCVFTLVIQKGQELVALAMASDVASGSVEDPAWLSASLAYSRQRKIP